MLFKIICNGDTTPLGLAAILGPCDTTGRPEQEISTTINEYA